MLRQMTEQDPKKYLLKAIQSFETVTERAVGISQSRLRVVHTGRQNRVLMVFAKMITHAMSIQLLYSNSVQQEPEMGLLDHFSIGALTRTLIDASIMTLYLSEPSLCVAEWDLRRHVLFLHDATNRKRFLTAMRKYAQKPPPPGEADAYYQNKEGILEVIKRRGKELRLGVDRVKELSNGQLVFMHGVRGAVREAGLDVTEFEFVHTYLSNHVHSHPVSVMRAEKISFSTPTDFQLSFCGLCLESAAVYIDAATKRVDDFTGDIARDPNGYID